MAEDPGLDDGRADADLVVRGCDVLVRPGDLRRGVDLLISGGRVSAIQATGPARPVARVLDGGGLLAVPGLVNAHTHSSENCLRGVGESLPLEMWLCTMFGVGGRFEPEDHYVCALAGAVEMLRTGTTAVLDHLWMTPPSPKALDAAMRAYRDVGIRAAVAPLMSDTDVTGELASVLGVDLGAALVPVLPGVRPAEELLEQLAAAFASWHGQEDGRLRILAGPGGVQWCSDELLLGVAELARAHGSGIHVHLLETTVQEAACRLAYGRSGLQRLVDLELVGPSLSLPHSVHVDERDVEAIAEGGAVVVHNPAANLRLGSGRAPIASLLAAGATVALGTDGSASSDNQVLLDQVKLAALIHNDADADVWVDSVAALRMATTGGAAALGHREDGLGTLTVGAPADLVLIDRTGAGLAGAVEIEPALALSEDGRGVRHVFVAGRQVVADGRCLGVDEEPLRARLAELAARCRSRLDALDPAVELAVCQMRELRSTMRRRHALVFPGQGGAR